MIPFFDPLKTYEENYEKGPFGIFKEKKVFKNKKNPKYKIFDIPIHLPFGIPAGPLLNGAYVKAALDTGYDVVVYKTVRTKKYPCNPWPNVLSVNVKGNLTIEKATQGIKGTTTYNPKHLGITNSFGVPSYPPAVWQKDMKKVARYAKEGQVVIGSFQGTVNKEGSKEKYIKDFVLAAKLVKETGVKIMEANLSCPNEGTAHLLCFDVKTSKEIIEAVKEEIGNIPLVIKISYYKDDKVLVDLIKSIGRTVQGIASINTIPAKVLNNDGNQALPGNGRLISGICGAPVKWAGLEMVRRLKKLREELQLNYTIFGGGGVTTPRDYKEYKNAGSDVVMSATGAMWNPFLAKEIKESN